MPPLPLISRVRSQIKPLAHLDSAIVVYPLGDRRSQAEERMQERDRRADGQLRRRGNVREPVNTQHYTVTAEASGVRDSTIGIRWSPRAFKMPDMERIQRAVAH